MTFAMFMSILWTFLFFLFLKQAYNFYVLHQEMKRLEESFNKMKGLDSTDEH
jgi:hypothetical protein